MLFHNYSGPGFYTFQSKHAERIFAGVEERVREIAQGYDSARIVSAEQPHRISPQQPPQPPVSNRPQSSRSNNVTPTTNQVNFLLFFFTFLSSSLVSYPSFLINSSFLISSSLISFLYKKSFSLLFFINSWSIFFIISSLQTYSFLILIHFLIYRPFIWFNFWKFFLIIFISHFSFVFLGLYVGVFQCVCSFFPCIVFHFLPLKFLDCFQSPVSVFCIHSTSTATVKAGSMGI